jgi:hypothetical protein
MRVVTDTSKKWFLLSSGQVQGPASQEEIEALIPASSSPLIWGRGLPEWMPPIAWKQALLTHGAALLENAALEEPHWKYRLGTNEHGPYTYNELIDALKKETEHYDIEIFGEGFTGWTEIYGVQKIVDELGITRRAHARVPIMGTLKMETSLGSRQAKIISISEGGLGVNDAPELPIGEKFKAVISSPNLYMEMSCTCEVVYLGNDGYMGIKFANLPMEAHAAVIEYVNKFKNLGER